MTKLAKLKPCVVAWLLLTSISCATSLIGPERSLVHGVAVVINVQKIEHPGTPRNWHELGAIIDLKSENQLFFTLYGRRFDESYVFVEGVPWHGYGDGKIILIRTIPLKEGLIGFRKIYRYCLYETPSGEIVDYKGSEADFQRAFLAAGKPLPSVQGAGFETERVSGTEWSESKKTIAVASTIIAFTAVFLISANALRRRNRRIGLQLAAL
jgi:hypothetical protein